MIVLFYYKQNRMKCQEEIHHFSNIFGRNRGIRTEEPGQALADIDGVCYNESVSHEKGDERLERNPTTNCRTLFLLFLKIGALTFGGGYAMIALLEDAFVERRGWMEQSAFFDMVAIAESTPGPVAINSATYIGYQMCGVPGAVTATIAVCIPSVAVIFLISLFFDQFLSLKWVACAFQGIRVCVVYLILSAGLKLLKGLERTVMNVLLFAAVLGMCLAFSLFAVSFSSVIYILAGGVAGLLLYGIRRIRGNGGGQS